MKSKKMTTLSEIFLTKGQFRTINKQLKGLNTFQKYWQKIARDHSVPENIATFFAHSHPDSFNNGELSISCQSGLIANHARFMQNDIINTLNLYKVPRVSSIYVAIAKNRNNINSLSSRKVDREVSEGTIKTLKQFSQSCSSEKLKTASEKLLKQLEIQHNKS